MAHVGSGVWGIWDGGVMSWRATDLAEASVGRHLKVVDVPCMTRVPENASRSPVVYGRPSQLPRGQRLA
jgi:hypothetical protein